MSGMSAILSMSFIEESVEVLIVTERIIQLIDEELGNTADGQ